MRSSRSMWEPTWVSRSRCWLLTGDRLGHVCMSPEPVGSTHLRFGDARVVKDISMQQTEGCSESRMRSRTSREVPEWSGGKDLYMGSCCTDTGKSRGHIGIVPGPPERHRGSTLRGQPSRRASWATRGREPSPGGLGAPPSLGPMRLGLGGGETLVGAPPLLGGQAPHPWPPPPWRSISKAAPPLGGLYKGGGEGGQPDPCCIGASLSPLHLSLSPQKLGEALLELCCIHHHVVVLLDLHQPLLPPCWIKKEETSIVPYVC
ncbi:hypothetical protein ACQJBY_048019 [Aegilops geniculata]